MSKVSAGKKQHRSLRGKPVDMALLQKRNELTPAVGNARVNARGDELGPGGTIIRKREDIVDEHYQQAGQSVHSAPVNPVADTPVVAEATPVVEKATRKVKVKADPVAAELTSEEAEIMAEADADDKWIEDESGNFVQKGS
jgi:hypothetical protein|tara:strand:+ start:8559 stop:8981 length:423 start_codon:yes stop_codon:yes gene_type:complete